MNEISERDNRFMSLAQKTAELSLELEYRFGAVITDGSQIVSIACNSNKTHPHIFWRNKYDHKYRFARLHAEARAIIRAKTNLKGCTIYIYRARNLGDAGNSFPCRQCFSMIEDVGIRRVVYVKNNNFSVVKI